MMSEKEAMRKEGLHEITCSSCQSVLAVYQRTIDLQKKQGFWDCKYCESQKKINTEKLINMLSPKHEGI